MSDNASNPEGCLHPKLNFGSQAIITYFAMTAAAGGAALIL